MGQHCAGEQQRNKTAPFEADDEQKEEVKKNCYRDEEGHGILERAWKGAYRQNPERPFNNKRHAARQKSFNSCAPPILY
jgi:hypothetical protein